MYDRPAPNIIVLSIKLLVWLAEPQYYSKVVGRSGAKPYLYGCKPFPATRPHHNTEMLSLSVLLRKWSWTKI